MVKYKKNHQMDYTSLCMSMRDQNIAKQHPNNQFLVNSNIVWQIQIPPCQTTLTIFLIFYCFLYFLIPYATVCLQLILITEV
jgi:hypothetical protein